MEDDEDYPELRRTVTTCYGDGWYGTLGDGLSSQRDDEHYQIKQQNDWL